jgi:uncharacterized protein YjfI (DUF2170 family)
MTKKNIEYGSMENGFYEKVKMDKFNTIILNNNEEVYLSGVIAISTLGGAEYRWQLNEYLSKDTLNKIKKEVTQDFNDRRKL